MKPHVLAGEKHHPGLASTAPCFYSGAIAESLLYDCLFTVPQPDDKFQFERNGYFVADRKDHTRETPVFNLAVTLKDSWGR